MEKLDTKALWDFLVSFHLFCRMTVPHARHHGNVSNAVWLCYCAELTASADVDVQVAFDNGAVFEGLSGVHRVDDLLLTLTHFITETITGCAGHTGDRQRMKVYCCQYYPRMLNPPFILINTSRFHIVCVAYLSVVERVYPDGHSGMHSCPWMTKVWGSGRCTLEQNSTLTQRQPSNL